MHTTKPWSNDSQSAFYNLLDRENLHRTEGSSGVSSLCKLVRLLGYKDPMYFGRLGEGGIVGDLICFFEDNPGAIEALHQWIADNADSFDALEDYQDDENDEDDDNDEDESNC